MKIFLFLLMSVTIPQMAQAVVSGLATVERSQFSEWGTFQVHGSAAKELYELMQVPVQMDGIKRGPSITCVKAQDDSYYCSMSVNPAGKLEGDGISSIDPHPGVGMGNR